MANFNNCAIHNNCLINNNCVVENDCIVHGLVTNNIITPTFKVNDEEKHYNLFKAYYNVPTLGDQIIIADEDCHVVMNGTDVIIKSGETIKNESNNLHGNIKLLPSNPYQYVQLCNDNGMIVIGSNNFGYNGPSNEITAADGNTVKIPEGAIYFKIIDE